MLKIIVVAFLLVYSFFIVVVRAVDFEIVNNATEAISVGVLGNADKEALENGGFVLEAGATKTITAAEDWAGKFWARTWCDAKTNHCLTGDCGDKLECQGDEGAAPATLAEITLKGDGGLDTYDISLVNGFNVAVAFEPVDGSGDGGDYSCKKATCSYNFNKQCPDALKLNSEHGVIGCKSACVALDTDQYCCRGEYGTSDTCIVSEWPVDYASYFKAHCHDAYSYTYDHNNTFTCKAQKYIVTFGVDVVDDRIML
ncbi:hypothetical protein NQ318_014447 [Aromia moschata]|uniref:Uncharacterized protein n=1 Tax=Aromia moschata TaxID=1265417 RepID=A0AAV8XTN6_9CUCU|nr:hypothetical protein NQ318_014447 [Aromia moschata]